MPFVYDPHWSLALGQTGVRALLVVAIVWTIDCFAGFYLTLPVVVEKFLGRWKPPWLIKRRAGFFRLDFDLHRASGRRLWPMLFVFARSSVNLAGQMGVYDWVTATLFDYRPPMDWFMAKPQHKEDQPPKLVWRAAQATGGRLVEEQARIQGFKIEKPAGRAHLSSNGITSYEESWLRLFEQFPAND